MLWYPEWFCLSVRVACIMIELNPVRQRISGLTDRVLSLRGYL
jgi:hypothetical protein